MGHRKKIGDKQTVMVFRSNGLDHLTKGNRCSNGALLANSN